MSTNTTSSPLRTTWQPEPTLRGTFSIISTCLATLAICLWSSVHVDIPTRGRAIRKAAKKCGWLLGGLLAPEGLLTLALYQWWVARGLVKEAQAKGIKWTLTDGFYAVMGGFVIDTTPYPILGEETRFVLTPSGVRFVLKHAPGLLPSLSRGSIQDRSKRNGLATSLFVSQFLYFYATAIARYQQSLPSSLLEVVTLAHCLCTLVTYVVWWEKPLNIDKPTIIEGIRASELAALLQMLGAPTEYIMGGFLPVALGKAEWSRISNRPNHEFRPAEEVLQGGPYDVFTQPGVVVPHTDLFYTAAVTDTTVYSNPSHRPLLPVENRIHLGPSDTNRLILASRAARHYASQGADLSEPWPVTLVDPQRGLLSAVVDLATASTVWKLVPLNVALLVYALPHLCAWNAHFPTPLERTLWRFAVGGLPTSGAIAFLSCLVNAGLRRVLERGKGVPETLVGIAMLVNAVVVCFAWWAIFMCSTGYLIAESVRELWYLPADSFTTPRFSNYWPHFS